MSSSCVENETPTGVFIINDLRVISYVMCSLHRAQVATLCQ